MYGTEYRGPRRDADFRRSRSRTRSRSRSPRRRREREDYDTGPPPGNDDGRGRFPHAPRRSGGEPLSYKAFIAELPDHVSPAEAEARYAAYKRERGVQYYQEYWQAHKDEELLRQQFDPRRLQHLLEERTAAARVAAAAFDLVPALKENGGAEAEAAKAGDVSDGKRVAHDVAQAHRLIQALDTEKGIEPLATLNTAVQNAAARGESEVGATRAVLNACTLYLWVVHGVDYFQGTELSLADYRTRESRLPSAIPDGEAKAWEAVVDAAWQRRTTNGDPVQSNLGTGRAESSVEEFLHKSPQFVSENKYRCGVPGCTKMFMSEDFVRKHVQSKHPEELERCRQQALDEIYRENYCKFAQSADASAGPQQLQRVREPRQDGGGKPGSDRRGRRRYNDFGPPGGGHPYGRSPPGGFPGHFMPPGAGGPYMAAPMVRYVDLDSSAMAAQPARAVVDYGDL